MRKYLILGFISLSTFLAQANPTPLMENQTIDVTGKTLMKGSIISVERAKKLKDYLFQVDSDDINLNVQVYNELIETLLYQNLSESKAPYFDARKLPKVNIKSSDFHSQINYIEGYAGGIPVGIEFKDDKYKFCFPCSINDSPEFEWGIAPIEKVKASAPVAPPVIIENNVVPAEPSAPVLETESTATAEPPKVETNSIPTNPETSDTTYSDIGGLRSAIEDVLNKSLMTEVPRVQSKPAEVPPTKGEKPTDAIIDSNDL